MAMVPSASTGTFMKKLMLATTSFSPMPGQRAEEVGVAARRVRYLVAEQVAGGATAAADGVVPAAHRVCHDREELGRAYGIDAVTLAEIDILVVLHRVRRVVAVGGIVGVVAKEVDGLLALEVHDAERLPRRQHARPVLVGGDHHVLQSLTVHESSLLAGISAIRGDQGTMLAPAPVGLASLLVWLDCRIAPSDPTVWEDPMRPTASR